MRVWRSDCYRFYYIESASIFAGRLPTIINLLPIIKDGTQLPKGDHSMPGATIPLSLSGKLQDVQLARGQGQMIEVKLGPALTL
ncbi:hypothetical protein RRG08_034257 [Elysia crispata]|uniref:Uncharacterized protein n=1 Tax=Elysia crispata TaxID=231223 RepID=A0AAE1A0H2_9GAST|nr:hypothetical protein RRG08_034257 [Elysia crispata]